MSTLIILASSGSIGMNTTTGYIFGVIIAIFILGYLAYTLFKPDKF